MSEIRFGVKFTTVTITSPEAGTIYYKIGYGNYQKYTGPFEVDGNTTIRAYYVRESDGKQSSVSYYKLPIVNKFFLI